jgi:hypothetical protein
LTFYLFYENTKCFKVRYYVNFINVVLTKKMQIKMEL